MSTMRCLDPAGVWASAGTLVRIPSAPPADSRPLVIMMTRSGAASMSASSVMGRIPFQPISLATSMPPREVISESVPDPSPKR